MQALFLFLALFLTGTARAQQAQASDTASVDAIIGALYAVISGPAGEDRDWDRFRSLFAQGARLWPNATAAWDPETYITQAGPSLEGQGFHERELHRLEERHGPLVHAWSTYETVYEHYGATERLRGVNSIQLFHDGARWWILGIAWASETSEAPLPQRYLP